MPRGKAPRRWAGTIAALALACILLPTSALAVATRPREGDLSPRLAELAKPSVRAAPPVAQARALSVAVEGPGSLLREGSRVLVEVRFDKGAAASVDALRAAGAKVVNVSRRYQTVTVAAKPDELKQLAGVQRVASASEVLTPITAASTCPSGIAVSEGDAQLRAAGARAAFGVDGTGVTVGILSDSFDRDELADTHESEDVESGDLPGVGNSCPGEATPVNTALDNYEPGPEESPAEDEGRAMAQIVHDLAPAAKLAFATAFTGLTAFADNVEELAANGAAVIADDVSYFEEPFFQEGPVGVAVSNVTATGVNYFSSAGNNNLIDAFGRNIASWEAPAFRNAGGCPTGLPVYATQCMDFNPGAPADSTFGVKVSPGATLRVDLQWNQPWNGVTTDLDVYLLSSANKLLGASENSNAGSTHMPFEFVPWTNSTGTAQTVRIAINRCDSICGGASGGDTGSPRLKFVLLENGGGVTSTEYPESSGGPEPDVVGPTIFGHNGAEGAMSMGAIRYDATEAPEIFSSRGPVTHYFDPVNGVTAAAPLVTPKEIIKPDVVATDGGADTFFGSCLSNTWRFFGTSAAAPHAAAVAALERQAATGATPVEVAEEVKQAQIKNADPVGAFPPTAVGGGIVNAGAAIAELKSEPFSEPILPIGPSAPQNCELPEPPPPAGPEEKIIVPNPPIEVPAPEKATPPRPRTLFLQHPPRIIRTRHSKTKAVFRFGASETGVAGESGVTFICRMDGEPFRACRRRFAGRFGIGAHVLRVVATDAAGNADRSPAVFRFRVKQLEIG